MGSSVYQVSYSSIAFKGCTEQYCEKMLMSHSQHKTIQISIWCCYWVTDDALHLIADSKALPFCLLLSQAPWAGGDAA